MTPIDRARLVGCATSLIAAVEQVLDEMEHYGHPMLVTDGWRTVEQQQAIWWSDRLMDADGRVQLKPSIVKPKTWADGILVLSNHQHGRAADCAFLVDHHASWDEHLPWTLYGDTAERHGLAWGGRWMPPKTDKPHVELR